jgi:hypothetical protein
MAHFAQIINNLVQKVIVIDNLILLDENNQEQEQLGIDFCKSLLGSDTEWVQTSYNNSIRYNYAGIGFTWDPVNQAFYAPQPFNSWTLDSNYHWQPPVPYPTDGNEYFWDESIQDWVDIYAYESLQSNI